MFGTAPKSKVIEEAPSPFLDEGTRKAMGEVAVQAPKHLVIQMQVQLSFL